jgi:hypothetical protein
VVVIGDVLDVVDVGGGDVVDVVDVADVADVVVVVAVCAASVLHAANVNNPATESRTAFEPAPSRRISPPSSISSETVSVEADQVFSFRVDIAPIPSPR